MIENGKAKNKMENYSGSSSTTPNDPKYHTRKDLMEDRYGSGVVASPRSVVSAVTPASSTLPVRAVIIKADKEFTVDEFRKNINSIRTTAQVAYVQVKTKHYNDEDPSLSFTVRVPPIWKLKFEYMKTQYSYNDHQRYDTPEQLGDAIEAVSVMLFAATRNGFIKVDNNTLLFIKDIVSPVSVTYQEEEIIPTDVVEAMSKDNKKVVKFFVPAKYLKDDNTSSADEITKPGIKPPPSLMDEEDYDKPTAPYYGL